jgi:hypothetical protein
MGSNAPVGETVSTAGRRGMIPADGWQRQKGFSGGKSRPAVIVGCSRPPSARDIVRILTRFVMRSQRLMGIPLNEALRAAESPPSDATASLPLVLHVPVCDHPSIDCR